MTDDELSTLLRDRVAQVAAADLTSRAWAAARRRRQRRRVLVAGGVAGAVVAVVGTTYALGPWDGSRPVDPAGPVEPMAPSSTPVTDGEPLPNHQADGYLSGGIPVYFAPTVREEETLPRTHGLPTLPEQISLNTAEPWASAVDQPIPTALVAVRLAQQEAVYLYGASGERRLLDTSRLHEVADAGGNRHPAELDGMLSPGGEYLAFPQGDLLTVFHLGSATWHDVALPAGGPYEFVGWTDQLTVRVFGDHDAVDVAVTPTALTAGARTDWTWPTAPAWLGPRAQSYGYPQPDPAADPISGSWFADADVTDKEGNVLTSRPEVILSHDDGTTRVLAFTDSVTAGPNSPRSKGCCATVPIGGTHYATRTEDGYRLIGWSPGTHDFFVLLEIRGGALAVSYAADRL